jgi:hypothetical protein
VQDAPSQGLKPDVFSIIYGPVGWDDGADRASDGLVTRSVAGYRYGGNWVISTGGTYTPKNGS